MKTERFKMWDCQPSGWDWKGESAEFVSCLESNDEVYIDLLGSKMMAHACKLFAFARADIGNINFIFGDVIIDGKNKTKIVATVKSAKKQKEIV